MQINTRFNPGDRIFFHRDGHYFPALITAIQIDVAGHFLPAPAASVRYCFEVPPYVLPEDECFSTAPGAPARQEPPPRYSDGKGGNRR